MHPLQAEIGQRVRADVLGDLRHTQPVGDQVVVGRHVHAHEAGVPHRRRTHAHMHLGRAALPNQLHQRAGGIPAHDRIIHQHHPFTLQVGAQRVKFQAHTLAAQRVIRLDEGAPDVAVLDQPFGEGDARLQAVPDPGGDRGVRHGHHNIGLNRRLLGQLLAHRLPHAMHDLTFQVGIGPREVHVLKHAQRAPRRFHPGHGGQPGAVQAHDFARRHMPHEACPNGMQRARFRGHHIAFIQLAQAQRAQSQRVAHGVDRIPREQHQRIGALRDLHKSPDAREPAIIPRAVLSRACRLPCLRRGGQDLRDQFAVGGGGQPYSPRQQHAAQVQRIGQVAVVGHRQRTVQRLDQVRLGVAQVGTARRGVAGMPQREVALQRREVVLVEHLGDQTHILVNVCALPVTGGDPGAFLPAMLQGEQAEERQASHVAARRIQAEHPAGFFQRIVLLRRQAFGIKHVPAPTRHHQPARYQSRPAAPPAPPL